MRLLAIVVGLALVVAPSRPAAGQHPEVGCLKYEPDTVSLTGILRRHTFPGPPNYESISAGDEPETGFYLHLARPVCTLQRDMIDYAQRGIRLVQLVLDSAGYATLLPHLGQRVTLRGTMFARITAHHHAPLLLEVLRPAAAQ
jgi:hypothetical protein